MFRRRKAPVGSRKDRVQDKKIAKLERVLATRELKYQDVAGVASVPTWNGTLVNLIAPGQGSTDITRVGDKIAIEKISFRFNGGMTGAGSNQIRIILLRDKTGGLGTTVNKVLDSSALATVNAAQGPFEEDQRKNFEVLYEIGRASCRERV